MRFPSFHVDEVLDGPVVRLFRLRVKITGRQLAVPTVIMQALAADTVLGTPRVGAGAERIVVFFIRALNHRCPWKKKGSAVTRGCPLDVT